MGCVAEWDIVCERERDRDGMRCRTYSVDVILATYARTSKCMNMNMTTLRVCPFDRANNGWMCFGFGGGVESS